MIALIPTVSVTRYVTPLREGGSLPGIVEADDLGTYVCKFRGAGQGVRVLVAEVIVAGLAERIGLRTPRLVALDLDPEIARYEADEEVQDLLNASPGLNLGADFLPGSFGFDGARAARAGAQRRPGPGAVAGRLRGQRRPLLAQPQPAALARQPWVIDHGAALYFHHGWAGGVGDPERFAPRPGAPTTTSSASTPPSCRGRRGAPRLPGRVRPRPRCWPRCPTSGSSRSPGAEDPDAVRAAYVEFLTARLGTPSGCRGWRHERTAASYEYVVLRCVPRVDREEFLNVGVVLHCQQADFLDVVWQVDRDRLLALDPRADVDQVCESLAFVDGGLRRPPDRRRRGRRADHPAVRLPQGPAQHRPPARPRPRRRHRRPRPPARAPPRAVRRLAVHNHAESGLLLRSNPDSALNAYRYASSRGY